MIATLSKITNSERCVLGSPDRTHIARYHEALVAAADVSGSVTAGPLPPPRT